VNLQDGAVRLPIAWDSPAQHFALVGDLLLRLKSEGSKMTFEQIAMPNASLRRVSVSDTSEAQNRLLCEKLSFFAKVVSEKQVVSGGTWKGRASFVWIGCTCFLHGFNAFQKG